MDKQRENAERCRIYYHRNKDKVLSRLKANYRKNKLSVLARVSAYYRHKKKDPKWFQEYLKRKRLSGHRLRDANIELYRERWRQRKRKQNKRYFVQYKMEARQAVHQAVLSGKIKKPRSCPKCHESKDRIEAHHPNYFRPLRIKWLCSRCHGKEHRKP